MPKESRLYYFCNVQFRYILSTLLFLWANNSFAQENNAPVQASAIAVKKDATVQGSSGSVSVSNHARKLYAKATNQYLKKDHERACKTMLQAINASPQYADAYSSLGEWYFNLRRYSDAADIFRKASVRCRNGNKYFAKPLAKSLLHNHEPGEALAIINANMSGTDKGEWKRLRDQAIFMQQELGKPWTDTVINMGPRVNTVYPELYPFVTRDTQTIHFTRRVKGVDEDFYVAHADSCGGWFAALNKGAGLNTPNHEFAQTFSADGHYTFYTRCDNRTPNGWALGGCDLYMAYRKDTSEEWSPPQGFGATINTPAYEGTACLSADNRELYFVSDKEGGQGGKDIWVTKFENGLWQQPRNLGPGINTAYDEIAPFLHIDNRTLYFASGGHPGMGGNDLFYVRRINDTTWSRPQNLGYPINTTADEVSISITEDGKRTYFSSDRDKVAGDYDLYEVNTPVQAYPVPVNIIKGYVYDSFSKERLNHTAIYVYEASTNEELYHFMSNRGDGSFMITLPADGKYIYKADRISYMETSAEIVHDVTVAEDFNIPMLPDDYVIPINDTLLFTINFPKNSDSLSAADRQLISSGLSPWLFEKGLVVTVNGYTDNSGNPLLNEELSFLRANLVRDEIESLGIDPVNIQSQGWGEANPIAPNDSDEGMSKNRRVEVIIKR